MPEPKFLLWLDLETTGTDTLNHDILEVGCVLTEAVAPFKMIDTFECIVQPERPLWRQTLDPFIVNMHTVNGLLAELNDGSGYFADTADKLLLAWLQDHGVGSHEALLSGSGVGHFDRRFMRVGLRQTEAYLQYPVLDVGVIRRALQLVKVQPPDINDDKPHRALSDVMLHLAEWRIYSVWFTEIPGTQPLGDD